MNAPLPLAAAPESLLVLAGWGAFPRLIMLVIPDTNLFLLHL